MLGSIRVPTLVTHRAADRPEAEYVTEGITGATRIETRGENASPANDSVVDAVLAFVHGEAAAVVPDTVLATLLFTDLVGSTELAAELGDRRWRDVLEAHQPAVQRKSTATEAR